MNALILLSILLSAALGIARGADLAFGTDAVTGLCTVGSVWWRYAALGAVVLAAVLIGRHCAGKAETVRSRQPLAGVLAFAGAVCFLAAAGAQLAVGLSATSSFVRSILECICAVWLSTLGRCWLTPSGWKKPTGGLYLAVAGSVLFYWNVLMLLRAVLEALCAFWMIGLGLSWLRKDWKTSTRSLTPAVLGSVIFYWCVLARFMENSSSWHRVAPTAAVWQALAALLLLSSLARALYLPKPENGRTLCAAGLAALCLCLCWELPHAVVLAVGAAAEPALLPELFAALALCCVGALGGVCAAACARRPE